MNLLSVDIKTKRKLSLKEVRLPAPARRLDPGPTEEEIVYSKLVAKAPKLEEIVELLDLVSTKTGKRIKKVKLVEDIKVEPQINSLELLDLVYKVVETQNNYSKEDIIYKIKEAINVNDQRAEIYFNLILEDGDITNIGGRYYLTESTPF